MYRVTLDLRQDDCPLTRASADYEVKFTTPYWHYSPETNQWELWVESISNDRSELEAGIRALRDTEEMRRFELKQKHDSHATLRVWFDETDAIEAITAHGGAVVGPFVNYQGRERWHLGFTDSAAIDSALSRLDRREEFSVIEHGGSETTMYEHFADSSPLIAACERLTETERDVLSTAVEFGYYETPREETLASLGKRCGVSDAAISKTLRRAERKLLETSVSALSNLEESTEIDRTTLH
jgi:predicted DNA binding protein